MSDPLLLPKIYVEKGQRRYDLHWDYQSTKAEKVLDENYDFLKGYIGGCFDALADGKAEVICLSANTGTFRNLSSENAEKLKQLLENVLYPLVKARHKKIVRDENLPHIRRQRERDNA